MPITEANEVRKMNINKIGHLNFFKLGKVNKPKSVNTNNNSYQVSISAEARKQAEIAKYQEIVKNSPDVRMDKINEVKKKIETGDYFNNFSPELLTNKIMNTLFKNK